MDRGIEVERGKGPSIGCMSRVIAWINRYSPSLVCKGSEFIPNFIFSFSHGVSGPLLTENVASLSFIL